MRKILNAFIDARQSRANIEIARMLQNSEYKNESQHYVLENIVLGKKSA